MANLENDGQNAIQAPRWLWKTITTGCLVIAVIHAIWPSFAIDSIFLILILIALFPWLAPIVKSLEFPGGWKIELQEWQKTVSRAESAGLLSEEIPENGLAFSLSDIVQADPNLALAGLRIEIEKRLSTLAQAYDTLPIKGKGVGQLLKVLANKNVLSREETSILYDMVSLLNAAVHGATIDYASASSAIETGKRLLSSLDARIREAKEGSLAIE